MLAALEEGVRGGVWFSLIDKVTSLRGLRAAWGQVQRNQGSGGVDRETIDEFQREAETRLSKLSEQLKDGAYHPLAVRRVYIPKPDGKKRPLGIPAVRDRVVQAALRNVLEPIFEREFCEHSYGFRPGRGAKDALRRVDGQLKAGYRYVLDADLKSYFDTIPHANLMAVVAERIVDGSLLALLKQWLKAPIIGADDQGKRRTVGGGKANRVGTPQGGVISPLLSNLYLHLLDRIWDRHRLKDKLGAHIVRYADDFVVLCKQGVEEPLNVVRHVMDRLGLTLNETKTHVVDAKETGFDFLGFTLQMSQGAKTGKWYPNVRPSDKAVTKITAKVTELTRRELTCIPLDDVVGSVNRSLRGWANYFHFRNSSLAMSKVRNHAEQRLRIHLRKRHKVKNWDAGYAKFPSRDLYNRHGLQPLPRGPGWKAAHALV